MDACKLSDQYHFALRLLLRYIVVRVLGLHDLTSAKTITISLIKAIHTTANSVSVILTLHTTKDTTVCKIIATE